jgi:exosortase
VAVIGAGLLAAWAGFLWKLRLNWSAESYYAYGVYVPALAGMLAWQRRRDASGKRGAPAPGWVLPLAAAALALYLPFRLGIDLNPFWRLALWGGGACLVAASWLCLWRLAGIRAAVALAFPCLFMLTAIPWPMPVEREVVQLSTRLVVAAATEILQLAGLAAVADGNIVRIGSCEVGVAEACSGIRSLQALGMLALFVGGCWRLALRRWLGLLAVAGGAAFGLNLARAVALSVIVFRGGEPAYRNWHDPVGLAGMVLGFGILLAAAWRLGRGAEPPRVPPPAASTAAARPLAGPSRAASLAVAAVCCVPEFLAAFWFDQPAPRADAPDFALVWPETGDIDMAPLDIDESVREVLKFDYGRRAMIRKGGALGEVWHYGFEAGSGGRSISAFVHSPTVCMTASGATLLQRHEPLELDLGPFALPFEHYSFRAPSRSGGHRIEVFWCLWDGGRGSAIQSGGFRAAFAAAILGRQRDLERKVVLIAWHGVPPSEARGLVVKAGRAFLQPRVDGKPVSFH